MDESATPPTRFVGPAPLPLEAAFDGGRLTSDGGLPWLGEAEALLGLCAALAAVEAIDVPFGVPRYTFAGGAPDGLLLLETLLYSLVPPHAGMRQYWRDFEALERWDRSEPHRRWWQGFVRDSGGTGFWHETYFLRGGMAAIYDDVPRPLGLAQFAPVVPGRGAMFGARRRLGLPGEAGLPPAVPEDALAAGRRPLTAERRRGRCSRAP